MGIVTVESNPELYNALFPDNEEETELEKKYNEVAELYSKAVKKKIEYRKEIERLNNIINDMDKQIDNLCNNQKREVDRLNNIINQFENRLKNRIKAYEDRQALGKGYELTNVMEIQLTIDRKYLKELQELKENK